jgi:hypothetical protein
MSTILLRRAAGFHDLARDYKVFLDGRECGQISNGGDCRLTVAPGSHRIQLKIDWCSSAEQQIHVGENEEFVMDCGNNISTVFAVMLYVSIWRAKYLWLSPVGPGMQRVAVKARPA